MAKGSCAPGEVNEIALAKDDGRVSIHVVWGGGAGSVFPACSGQITSVRAVNLSARDWIAELPAGRRGAQTIPAGTDRTFTGGALNGQIGLTTYAEVSALRLRPA